MNRRDFLAAVGGSTLTTLPTNDDAIGRDEFPEWVADDTDREDAVCAWAWDHANDARTALIGTERDPEAAKESLQRALTVLDEGLEEK
jgi:hypothetical protein